MAVDTQERNFLLEDVRKRFKQISEYNYFVPNTLEEDDGSDPLPEEPGNDAPAGNDAPQAPQDGGEGAEKLDFEDQPDTPKSDEGDGVQVQGGEGDAPMPPAPEGEDVNLDEPGAGDTVLDIDDLTQAQEKLNDKMNSIGQDFSNVNKRIDALNTSIEQIVSAIDANNASIQALMADMDKRMPSDEQKLDVRYHKSGPFNEKPEEYFDKAMQDNPNYDITTNGEKEYTLTEKDLETNPQTIRNSFRVTEDMQFSLKDAFNATKG